MMEQLIISGANYPPVVMYARQAVAQEVLSARTPQDRLLGQVRGVWRWVRDNIAFIMDPDNGRPTEFLSDVENILRLRAGDCDEHSIIAGAMLRSLGFRHIQLAVGGRSDVGPEHVFLIVWLDRERYVVVDTTLTDDEFGTLAGEGDPSWNYWVFKGRS